MSALLFLSEKPKSFYDSKIPLFFQKNFPVFTVTETYVLLPYVYKAMLG